MATVTQSRSFVAELIIPAMQNEAMKMLYILPSYVVTKLLSLECYEDANYVLWNNFQQYFYQIYEICVWIYWKFQYTRRSDVLLDILNEKTNPKIFNVQPTQRYLKSFTIQFNYYVIKNNVRIETISF